MYVAQDDYIYIYHYIYLFLDSYIYTHTYLYFWGIIYIYIHIYIHTHNLLRFLGPTPPRQSLGHCLQERIQDMAERLPRYWGIVKNFDNTRGLGFIECEETKEVYDKDTW